MDPLFRKLGIELPIIQAPMAGVSTPEMAAAVSNAGGLGTLGLSGRQPAEIANLVGQIRARTSAPFGVRPGPCRA